MAEKNVIIPFCSLTTTQIKNAIRARNNIDRNNWSEVELNRKKQMNSLMEGMRVI